LTEADGAAQYLRPFRIVKSFHESPAAMNTVTSKPVPENLGKNLGKNICIVGAGAIGGFVGAKLAQAGHNVSLIVRGAHLAAIQRDGLRLIHAGAEPGTAQVIRNLRVGSDLRAFGPQDVVILGMKAHQVSAVLDDLPALLHAQTIIVPMQNGIPWWYFQRTNPGADAIDPAWLNRAVETVDPGGRIAASIDPARILGCVVYPACELAAPGLIRHIEGERFPLGELDGSDSERVQQLAAIFVQAGLKSPVLSDIRAEIWLKLWGNLSFNPLSALTHATLVDICQYPPSRELAASLMREAEQVAARLGIRFRVTLEKRIAGAEKVGRHKTSMLQDVESGRDPEIDALVGAVLELGRLVGVDTPCLSATYALVKLLARTMRDDKVMIRACALPA